MGMEASSTMSDHWALRLAPTPSLSTEASTEISDCPGKSSTDSGSRSNDSVSAVSSSFGRNKRSSCSDAVNNSSQDSAADAKAPANHAAVWRWEKLPMVWAKDTEGLGGVSTAAGGSGGLERTGIEDSGGDDGSESELRLDPVIWDTDR